jgi:hypothetical protein
MAFLGPAAVAVHDDGDVTREAGKIEFFEEMRLFRGDGTEGFEIGTVVRHGDWAKPLYGAKLTQALGVEQAELLRVIGNQ